MGVLYLCIGIYTHVHIYICCAERIFCKVETGTKTYSNNPHIFLLKILRINSASFVCNLWHKQYILLKHDRK